MFEITNLFQFLYICLHTQPKNNFINTSQQAPHDSRSETCVDLLNQSIIGLPRVPGYPNKNK